MHWNHRVIKRTDKSTGEDYYAIHECYYGVEGEGGERVGWTKDPIAPQGESLADLRWCLEHMLKALDKPIIEDNED